MQQRFVRNAGILIGLGALCGALASTGTASIVDLTGSDNAASIGGALFNTSNPVHPSGTGLLDPFLTIKHTGNEAAYNTSGDLNSSFNQHSGADGRNRDLLLSDLMRVTVGGQQYYQFLLDINEPDGGTDGTKKNPGVPKGWLSFNQLQVYQTTLGGQTAGSWNNNDGRFNPTGLQSPALVYDMNPSGGTANGILLNYTKNGQGQGTTDLYVLLPSHLFDPAKGAYVLFYSQFGKPPGTAESDAGFEEWAALTVIPEPTSVLMGGLLLLPLAAGGIRALRKRS